MKMCEATGTQGAVRGKRGLYMRCVFGARCCFARCRLGVVVCWEAPVVSGAVWCTRRRVRSRGAWLDTWRVPSLPPEAEQEE